MQAPFHLMKTPFSRMTVVAYETIKFSLKHSPGPFVFQISRIHPGCKKDLNNISCDPVQRERKFGHIPTGIFCPCIVAVENTITPFDS